MKTKVYVNVMPYINAHGRLPRGRGSWAFCPNDQHRLGNYLDYVWWAPSGLLYTEAKKLAIKHFQAKNVTAIVVCS